MQFGGCPAPGAVLPVGAGEIGQVPRHGVRGPDRQAVGAHHRLNACAEVAMLPGVPGVDRFAFHTHGGLGQPDCNSALIDSIRDRPALALALRHECLAGVYPQVADGRHTARVGTSCIARLARPHRAKGLKTANLNQDQTSSQTRDTSAPATPWRRTRCSTPSLRRKACPVPGWPCGSTRLPKSVDGPALRPLPCHPVAEWSATARHSCQPGLPGRPHFL